MLQKQQIQSALAVERRMYAILLEIMDTTASLSESLGREDQVSFQMFLNMRQESIDQLTECREILQKQCAMLDQASEQQLRQILSNRCESPDKDTEPLIQLVEKNHVLLDRIIQSDRVINRRVGGNESYYTEE